MHVPMDVEARGWPLLFRCFFHMSDYGMMNCLLIELSSQPIFLFFERQPHVTQAGLKFAMLPEANLELLDVGLGINCQHMFYIMIYL